jgi:hypothetical protein
MAALKEAKRAATVISLFRSDWPSGVGNWWCLIGQATDEVLHLAVPTTLKPTVSGSLTCLETALTWSAIRLAAVSLCRPPQGAPVRSVHLLLSSQGCRSWQRTIRM